MHRPKPPPDARRTFHPYSRLPTELQRIISSCATFIEPVEKDGAISGVVLNDRQLKRRGCFCQGGVVGGRPCRCPPCRGKCGFGDGRNGTLSCYCRTTRSHSTTCTCAPVCIGFLSVNRKTRSLALETLYSDHEFLLSQSSQATTREFQNIRNSQTTTLRWTRASRLTRRSNGYLYDLQVCGRWLP